MGKGPESLRKEDSKRWVTGGAKHTNKHLGSKPRLSEVLTDASLKPSGLGRPQGLLHNTAIDPAQVCAASPLSFPLPAGLAPSRCSGSCAVQAWAGLGLQAHSQGKSSFRGKDKFAVIEWTWGSLAGPMLLQPARTGPREKDEVVNNIKATKTHSVPAWTSSHSTRGRHCEGIEQMKRTGLVKKVGGLVQSQPARKRPGQASSPGPLGPLAAILLPLALSRGLLSLAHLWAIQLESWACQKQAFLTYLSVMPFRIH